MHLLKDVVENREDHFRELNDWGGGYEAPSPYDLRQKYGPPVHVADNDTDVEVYYTETEKLAVLVVAAHAKGRWAVKVRKVLP